MSCNPSSQLKSPEGRFLNIHGGMSSQDPVAVQDRLLTARRVKMNQQPFW
jgi:hypothetical protein